MIRDFNEKLNFFSLYCSYRARLTHKNFKDLPLPRDGWNIWNSFKFNAGETAGSRDCPGTIRRDADCGYTYVVWSTTAGTANGKGTARNLVPDPKISKRNESN